MNLTTAQIAANRQSAQNLAKTQLGLLDTPTGDWTQAQRVSYDQALAKIIAQYPGSFTGDEVTWASNISKQDPAMAQLVDADFSVGDFAKETVKPAGDALQSIGQGAFTIANAAKWALPVMAAIAAVILLFSLARRTGASK